MKILVAGSSGLVGTALGESLRRDGHTVIPLVRPAARAVRGGEASWDPGTGELSGDVNSADAAVNLAGASIAGRRWNQKYKQVLRASRIDATRRLVEALHQLGAPPKTFLCASAVGYYGNRGDEVLTEESAPGADFLAGIARDWEAEALRAETAGMRTVILRFGMILAAQGGALPKMLVPFRLGLGGRIGTGRQWISWIALADVVGIIQQAIAAPEWRGVFNAVAPAPVTNSGFARALGRVLKRPTVFPAPAFAVRLVLGEMADALLLVSQRAVAKRLEKAGYVFAHSELEPALASILASR